MGLPLAPADIRAPLKDFHCSICHPWGQHAAGTAPGCVADAMDLLQPIGPALMKRPGRATLRLGCCSFSTLIAALMMQLLLHGCFACCNLYFAISHACAAARRAPVGLAMAAAGPRGAAGCLMSHKARGSSTGKGQT